MPMSQPLSRLPYTPDPKNNSWVAEKIWGHRIEQQPSQLLLLEFLSMAEGMHRQGKLLDSSHVSYRPYLCTQLRTILFKNAQIEEIHEEFGNSSQAWEEWLNSMDSKSDGSLQDFGFIRDRFIDFKEFVEHVKLLNRITVQGVGLNQWNRKRIAPIGPAALYDERNTSFLRTRVDFTRTGELAYLMLARAKSHREEIHGWLSSSFQADTEKNRLLCSLMNDFKPDLTDADKYGTYLPYEWMHSYDMLSQDVHALFSLKLPPTDTFNLLAPLLAFHVMLYQLHVAARIIGQEMPPTIVCEILGPRTSQVRKASVESLALNEALLLQAMESHLKSEEANDEVVQKILTEQDETEISTIEEFCAALSKTFRLKKPPAAGPSIGETREKIHAMVKDDFRKGANSGFRSMSDGAGLRSRKKTNRYRYCASDGFLRNLVYVTVTVPMKETEFLSNLYKRYGLVIGEDEAPKAVRKGLFQKNEFKKNGERLINQLAAMGLARRMSDSFTYIINPISQNNAS